MADLILDKLLRVAPLDQVGDVGMAQRVHTEFRRKLQLVTEGCESHVDVAETDPAAAFGRPEHAGFVCETGPCVIHPLREARGHPPQLRHGQNRTPARPGATRSLTPADLNGTEPTEQRRNAIGAQICDVKADRLSATETIGVDRLEDLRIPKGS